MITLLLIDDHPVVRMGYRRLLEQASEITVIAEAETGREGYRAYIDHQPDIVVVDLALPDIGGLEVTRKIIQRDPAAKILVFSAHENEMLARRARETGAKGFIGKRNGVKRMAQAVLAIAQGSEFFDEKLLPESKASGLDVLTPREFEVFRHLAEGRTVSDIAKLLNSSPKTVGVHQTRIMKKLSVANSAQLAHLALSHNLISLQPIPAFRRNK